MKKLIPLLLLLTSCTATFRGTLIDIEELSLQPAWAAQGKKTIVKETVSED
jgi:hypothetical protein